MRHAILFASILGSAMPWIGCGDPEPTAIEPEPAAEASSAPTRWVGVRAPGDGALLEAPAVARVDAEASGDVGVTLRARVERVHVRPGETVDAGDPIVDVSSPELLEAAARYAGSVRRLAAHSARADELDALRGEGLARSGDVFSQRALAAELRTERDGAAAILRGAGADPRRASQIVRRGYATLTAPVAGVVSAVRARRGEVVDPGAEPIARILGEAPARIEVRTAEAWPPATALSFVAVDGRSIELAPEPLATVVDPDDGTRLSWYAPLDAGARFQEGVRGVVQITGTTNLWQVPVSAVAQRTGESAVVRRRQGEEARVTVQVLATSGASALVRGDLQEGDEVAADSARHPETRREER